MNVHVEHLVETFEMRRVSRRELIAPLTALVAGAGSATVAQSGTAAAPMNPGTVNHISTGADNFDPDNTRVQLSANGYQD